MFEEERGEVGELALGAFGFEEGLEACGGEVFWGADGAVAGLGEVEGGEEGEAGGERGAACGAVAAEEGERGKGAVGLDFYFFLQGEVEELIGGHRGAVREGDKRLGERWRALDWAGGWTCAFMRLRLLYGG